MLDCVVEMCYGFGVEMWGAGTKSIIQKSRKRFRETIFFSCSMFVQAKLLAMLSGEIGYNYDQTVIFIEEWLL